MKTLPILNQKELGRFHAKVNVGAKNACWRYGDSDIQGRFWTKEGNITISRLMYFLTFKIDPGELQVCHTCDHKWCVNPDHFFLGTQSDNIIDCSKKGRLVSNVGSKHGYSKLTEADVLKIRDAMRNGANAKELAQNYKVCVEHIHNINRRVTWKHV